MSHRILVVFLALLFVFSLSSSAFARGKPHVKHRPVKKELKKKDKKKHHHHHHQKPR